MKKNYKELVYLIPYKENQMCPKCFKTYPKFRLPLLICCVDCTDHEKTPTKENKMDYNNASSIYTIEVSDEEVSICGQLTIEEAFDFINFFDRKGYKYINEGYNSTLLLTKKSILEMKDHRNEINESLSEGMFEKLYTQSQHKVNELQDLIKKLFDPENPLFDRYSNYKEIKEEYYKKQDEE